MVNWKMYAQCALLAFMLTPPTTIFIEAWSSLAIECAVYCCINFQQSCVAKPDMADHLTCGGTDGKPLVLHNLQPLRSSHSAALLTAAATPLCRRRDRTPVPGQTENAGV